MAFEDLVANMDTRVMATFAPTRKVTYFSQFDPEYVGVGVPLALIQDSGNEEVELRDGSYVWLSASAVTFPFVPRNGDYLRLANGFGYAVVDVQSDAYDFKHLLCQQRDEGA